MDNKTYDNIVCSITYLSNGTLRLNQTHSCGVKLLNMIPGATSTVKNIIGENANCTSPWSSAPDL